MKKINFLAAFAAAAAVLSCNPDDKPNNQKPEDVKFSLSEDNIKVSGLEKEYVVNVDMQIISMLTISRLSTLALPALKKVLPLLTSRYSTMHKALRRLLLQRKRRSLCIPSQ